MIKIDEKIAIIGLACRFPKSNSIDEYWRNLCEKKNCLTRFDLSQIRHDNSLLQDKTYRGNYVPVKGIIQDVDKFDAEFFGFSPTDAKILDPQQRHFLECAWEALEHSGNVPSKTLKGKMSVFAGMADSSYLQVNLLKNQNFCAENDWFQARVATSIGSVATQLSYRLNLHGKSISINTACSTSLVALGQACEDLLTGESYIALVGAAAINLPQENGYFYQIDGIESPEGRCCPYSHNANGTVFSNGVGVVVLKRLNDAIVDNDTVYAVIAGVGINNDGSDKLGYVAPSIIGQRDCILLALSDAGISASKVSYVEGHGTGTVLGDLVEVNALTEAYREHTEKKQYCVLGSVKGNIGHTDIAAGMGGLIKAILSLYYKKIPPTLNYAEANPKLNLSESPFYVNKQLIDWKSETSARFAGVSAFGVGGTNAHLILTECVDLPAEQKDCQENLFIISAKTKKSLLQNIDKLNNYFASQGEKTNLENVAYTLQVGREDFDYRAYAIRKSTDDIINDLYGSMCRIPNEEHSVVFMFPGQGSQYVGMSEKLIERFPFFKNLIDECSQIAKKYLNFDIKNHIFCSNNENNDEIYQTYISQLSIFIIEYSLAKLLMHLNIKPAYLIGHSVGEYVAACLAGVFSLEDAIFLLFERGKLMTSMQDGMMLAIDCTCEEFRLYQKDFAIDLAAYNSPSNCVAAGLNEDIEKLSSYLAAKGKYTRKLKTNKAFHSRLVDSIRNKFDDVLRKVKFLKPEITIISTSEGGMLSQLEATDPNYWSQHLRKTVQFNNGIKYLLNESDDKIFIEVGPGDTLSNFVKEISASLQKSIITSNILPNHKHKDFEDFTFLKTIGILWQIGIKIEWMNLHEGKSRKRISLPSYSFQKKRYWVEPDHEQEIPLIKEPPENWFFQPSWVRMNKIDSYINLHKKTKDYSWIVFAEESALSKNLVSNLKEEGASIFLVEMGNDFKEINPRHFLINVEERSHYFRLINLLKNIPPRPIAVVHLFSYDKKVIGNISEREIDLDLSKGFFSVLYLVQALTTLGENEIKFSIVTYASQQVFDKELLIPINAALVGPCRVIAKEHPWINLQLIDLSINESESLFLSRFFTHQTLSACNELHPITAYRENYIWKLTYNRVYLNFEEKRFRNKGIYLVTGGLGGIAIKLCVAIAKEIENPTFILLSRSNFPPQNEWRSMLVTNSSALNKKIKFLQGIIDLGATIDIIQCDVSELNSLKRVAESIFLTHGKVDGILHTAGVPGGGIVSLKSKEEALKVLRPKVHGSYNLAIVFWKTELDFIIFFSSISSVLGEAGQIDYCAANACLDAFTNSNLFNSKFINCINWNTWREVGMAVETDRPSDVNILDRKNDISPEEGQQLFLKIMQNNFRQIAVSTCDLNKFSQMVINSKIVYAENENDIDEKENKSYRKPDKYTEIILAQLWSSLLGTTKIGLDDNFFNLGGHSLKALRLLELINKDFKRKLVLQDIYEAPTLEKLASKIDKLDKADNKSKVTLLLREGDKALPPIFLFHPVGGTIFCYKNFVSILKLKNKIYGLQDPNVIDNKTHYNDLISMARAYYTEIITIQPKGPYYFIGYSFGATVAYEIAHMLQLEGEVTNLVMIDGWAIFSQKQRQEFIFKETMRVLHPELDKKMVDNSWIRMKMLVDHPLSRSKQDLILFKAAKKLHGYQDIDSVNNGWEDYTSGQITTYIIAADHESIIEAQFVKEIFTLLMSHWNTFNISKG